MACMSASSYGVACCNTEPYDNDSIYHPVWDGGCQVGTGPDAGFPDPSINREWDPNDPDGPDYQEGDCKDCAEPEWPSGDSSSRFTHGAILLASLPGDRERGKRFIQVYFPVHCRGTFVLTDLFTDGNAFYVLTHPKRALSKSHHVTTGGAL